MGIQRGDQVYYRGEVWTVLHAYVAGQEPGYLKLRRERGDGHYTYVDVWPKFVQRVEQVR